MTEAEFRKQYLDQAEAAVDDAAARICDASRPGFHFRPRACWMNDPNGTLYHNGFYHVFYQFNPYGDDWGHMHWGHARSRDLVRWEHLPIALWPSKNRNEKHCYSGCATITPQGNPLILYTMVPTGQGGARGPFEQWAAIGDADLIHWDKHPDNPVLDLRRPAAPRLADDWRDPYIFTHQGRTFMVLGALLSPDQGGKPAVVLYETHDPAHLAWDYRGVLIDAPSAELRFFECPNFFHLGGKFVLLTSPFGPVRYYDGDFDIHSLAFTPQRRGPIDYTDHYYATNTIFDPAGRCILLGWIRGFPTGRGWNGCLALPRVLSRDAQGRLAQQPIPELATLRQDHAHVESQRLEQSPVRIAPIADAQMEFSLTLDASEAQTAGLRLTTPQGQTLAEITLNHAGRKCHVGNTTFDRQSSSPTAAIRAFLDRSVLEVFIDGLDCCTLTLPGNSQAAHVELFALGGQAGAEIDIWTLKPIW